MSTTDRTWSDYLFDVLPRKYLSTAAAVTERHGFVRPLASACVLLVAGSGSDGAGKQSFLAT